MPDLVDLFGIESPGLTASLPLADAVLEQLNYRFDPAPPVVEEALMRALRGLGNRPQRRDTPRMSEAPAEVRTFLIADIRGYTRFTEEYGDEAAARLTARFVEVVEDEVEGRGGTVVEIRGDEILAVFTSARQAIRAAVDLQERFGEMEADSELPLLVGIGIDAGEAVLLEDGSYRGAALNIAARLCGRAHGGQVLVSEATSRLAGRLPGIVFSDRGRAHLKNVSEPVHTLEVHREHASPPPSNRWILMFFGKPGRSFGWRLGLGVVLVAAVTAGIVVYFTARGPEASKGAAGEMTTTTSGKTTQGAGMTMGTGASSHLPPAQQLMSYATAHHWSCSDLAAVEPGAQAALACHTTGQAFPVVFEMTIFRSEKTMRRAYDDALQQSTITPNTGSCRRDSWSGEVEWFHGVGEPGGRAFCHLDEAGQRAYVTWTSDAGRKLLVVAQLNGLQHRHLYSWWQNVRHDLV